MRNLLKQQRGVSLLELALILPLIVIFITGIIDYGTGIRTVKRLSFAAKTGARYAASQSASGTFACGAAVSGSCQGSGDTVTGLGKWAACESLNEAGLTGDDWEVEVEVADAANAGLLQPSLSNPSGQVVRVTAKRRADAGRFCIVCADQILSSFGSNSPDSSVIKSVSTFALEGSC